MSHSHARDQHHLEDMLGARGGVSHGSVEGPVDTEGHLPQVALRLLAVAIVWDVDVGEHAVEVETRFLACKTTSTTTNLLIITSGLQLDLTYPCPTLLYIDPRADTQDLVPLPILF